MFKHLIKLFSNFLDNANRKNHLAKTSNDPPPFFLAMTQVQDQLMREAGY